MIEISDMQEKAYSERKYRVHALYLCYFNLNKQHQN